MKLIIKHRNICTILSHISRHQSSPYAHKHREMASTEKVETSVITTDEIPTWYEYWNKNKETIKKISDDRKPSEQKIKDLAHKISIWQGDITKLQIDAIVNAANSTLLGGGGVDGAIHRAAGPELGKECKKLKGCNVGEVKKTAGHNLPAKKILHTVGPRDSNPEMLRQCYENSLMLAMKKNLRTIAFPCISTGVYGFPPRRAAQVAIPTVRDLLLKNPDAFDRVIFCLFLDSDKDIYEEFLQEYIGP